MQSSAGARPEESPGGDSAQVVPPAVSAVLAALEAVDQAPVADHVAVFETAHAELRAALEVPEPQVSAPSPTEHQKDGA